jgi:hypothetical protein
MFDNISIVVTVLPARKQEAGRRLFCFTVIVLTVSLTYSKGIRHSLMEPAITK